MDSSINMVAHDVPASSCYFYKKRPMLWVYNLVSHYGSKWFWTTGHWLIMMGHEQNPHISGNIWLRNQKWFIISKLFPACSSSWEWLHWFVNGCHYLHCLDSLNRLNHQRVFVMNILVGHYQQSQNRTDEHHSSCTGHCGMWTAGNLATPGGAAAIALAYHFHH